VTTTTIARTSTPAWQISTEAKALLERFPPRPVPVSWPQTRQDRAAVEARLAETPFRANDSQTRSHRKLSLQAVLDWLELYPGQTWQRRWNATGAGGDGHRDWRIQLVTDLDAAGLMHERPEYVRKLLGKGMIQLIGGDYIRPSTGWLMATSSPVRIANELAAVRDPHGIAELRAVRMDNTVGDATMLPAIEKVAVIMASKGGTVRDVTVGDCLETMRISREVFPGPTRSSRHSPVFYQLLHSLGVFPADAPPTVRMFSPLFAGRVPVEQLVDRYQVSCRPVRDLLVDYLRERQPAVDYSRLTTLATALALSFWKDLERPPRHRLTAAAPRDRRLETTDPHPNRALQGRIRRNRRNDGPTRRRRRRADDGAQLLPRPRSVGARRASPVGAVGSAVPDPTHRCPAQEDEIAAEGADGPTHPRRTAGTADPGRGGRS
jgi:hypothetical protein